MQLPTFSRYLSLLPFMAMAMLKAETPQSHPYLNLDLSTEASLGQGDYSPYYLVSNHHGLLDPNPNTGYLRVQLEGGRSLGNLQLQGCLDVQALAHAQDAFRLHQGYVAASWHGALLEIGSREQAPQLRDFRLSSGSLIWSGNARPLPQVRLASTDYFTLPFTHNWLQLKLDMSYGRCLDDDYLEKEYADYLIDKTGYGRSWITTGVWLHQKRFALRTQPQRPWVFTFGAEHAVQFGGHIRSSLVPELSDADFSPSLTDFLRAFIPISGGDNAAEGDQKFIYGNHLGAWNLLLERQWDTQQGHHRLGFYYENLFEDGSGAIKHNGMDGLWGIEYHNPSPSAWVRGIVLEYLQTTDQSGPIHWAPTDFPGQDVSTALPHAATGQDDYYNNYFYTGYSHFGMACGSPMLKSPAFNADHFLRFTDNRVRAWHMGLEGALSPFTYRLLASYRQSWGTYFYPNPSIYESINALLELSWQHRNWLFSAGYAFNHGELYGNNQALSLRVRYHLPLL